MALPTWLWILIICFMSFFGIIITVFSSFYFYMRGSNRWGAGKLTIDARPIEAGGEPKIYNTLPQGGGEYWIRHGGNKVVMDRVLGMFKKESTDPVDRDNVSFVGTRILLIGKKQILDQWKESMQDVHAQNTMLRNLMSQYANDLAKSVHNPDEKMRKMIKHMEELGRAASLMQPKKDMAKSGGKNK